MRAVLCCFIHPSPHREPGMQLSQAGTDTDGHLHAHTLTGDLVLTRSHARAHTRTPPKKKILSMSSGKGFAGIDQNPWSQQPI